MTKHDWTEAEKKYLWTDMTNSEISEEIGVPVDKVRRARRYYTGHYCEMSNARIDDRRISSEARILDLAKRLGIRIGRKETI